MTTVTVFTAERMAEIEAQAVIGAELVDGHIIFERHNGTTFDGGEIDITVLGSLAFAKDTDVFYIYQESADPLVLSANVQTPLSGTIMDVSDGDPPWGHWDADDTDAHFIIDEAGFYNVYAYAVVDSTGSSTGRSTLHISGTLGSNEVEFTHMTGQDARLICQLTAMYDIGDGIRADVMSTVNALELTYAEIYIQKCNITMEGTSESSGGGGGGGTPFIPDDVYAISTDEATVTLTSGLTAYLTESILEIEDPIPDWALWNATENRVDIFEDGWYQVQSIVSAGGTTVTGYLSSRVEIYGNGSYPDNLLRGELNSGRQPFINDGADARCEGLRYCQAGSWVSLLASQNSGETVDIINANIVIRKTNLATSIEGIAETDPLVKAIKGGQETAQTHGSTGATQTIDVVNGNVHVVTQDMACTYTFTNPTSTTTACSFTLIMTSVTGAATWPSSVNWPSGTAPTLTGRCVLTFVTVNGGTDWDGFLSGSGMA